MLKRKNRYEFIIRQLELKYQKTSNKKYLQQIEKRLAMLADLIYT